MSAPLLFIGTSGWSYEHWRGRFYPAELNRQEWLAYYTGRFNSVELNMSFYAPENAAELRELLG